MIDFISSYSPSNCWSFLYVPNGSKNYDAQIEINCTGGNEYLSVNNDFDTTTKLSARETRRGSLTITLRKQYTETSLETEVKCTITAFGVERTELNEIEVPTTISKYYIGKEIAIANEKFNVISSTTDTVTLLAQYNLDATYRQSDTANYVKFSNGKGWSYTPGPKEITIQDYEGNVKTYINEYVSYLKTQTGDENLIGNLISLAELGELECIIVTNYKYVADSTKRTCENSNYLTFIKNNQYWWTSSAIASNEDNIWVVTPTGILSYYSYSNFSGIRPIITMSKSTYDKYYVSLIF